MTKYVLATCALVTMLTTVACGSDGADGGGGSQKRVYYLLPTIQDQAYLDDKAGAEATAKKVTDVDFTIDAANSVRGASDMVRRLESAITKHYDVIAVLPGGVANEITPALRKARDAGIKIVTAGAHGTPVADLAETDIELDYFKNGEIMGEFAKERIPRGSEVGIIDCGSDVPQTKAVNDGIRAALEGSAEVVAHLDSECDPGKSRAAAENMLTAHPAIRAIFSIWDVSALGAMKAIDDDVLLIGGGGQKDAVRMIAADNTPLKASTNARFFETGERLAAVAAKVARGERVPKTIKIESSIITKKNAAQTLSNSGKANTVG